MKQINLCTALFLSSLFALSAAVAQDNKQSLGDFARKERERKKEQERAPGNQAALSPAVIPPGIRYKFADETILRWTAELSKRVLAPDYNGNEHILKKVTICGPFIWRYLSAQGKLGTTNLVCLRIQEPAQWWIFNSAAAP